MTDLYALVPGRGAAGPGVIALDGRRNGNRQEIRATAMVFSDPASAAIRSDLERLGQATRAW